MVDASTDPRSAFYCTCAEVMAVATHERWKPHPVRGSLAAKVLRADFRIHPPWPLDLMVPVATFRGEFWGNPRMRENCGPLDLMVPERAGGAPSGLRVCFLFEFADES